MLANNQAGPSAATMLPAVRSMSLTLAISALLVLAVAKLAEQSFSPFLYFQF